MKKCFVFAMIALAVGCSPEAETWRMTELCFESSTDYTSGGGDRLRMDVQFVHGQDTLVRPAFWDGANIFLVRFAPTRRSAICCISTPRIPFPAALPAFPPALRPGPAGTIPETENSRRAFGLSPRRTAFSLFPKNPTRRTGSLSLTCNKNQRP